MLAVRQMSWKSIGFNMTELELYKFVNDNDCEWHWNYDGHLTLFISHHYLKDFCDMLQYSDFDDGGLPGEQRLCYDGSVALCQFEEVCEIYDIEPENVFPKEDN